MRTRFLAILILATALFGACSCPPQSSRWPTPEQVRSANITVECLNEDMRPYINYWRFEVRRRYDDAHLIFAHGTVIKGVLHIRPDFLGDFVSVEEYVKYSRSTPIKGNRRLVFITCNDEGVDVTAARVTYAKQIVWLNPDSFTGVLTNQWRDKYNGPGIGDIFEFTENK